MSINTNTMDQITWRRAPDQPSTKSIATSNVFTFIVGTDQTEFTIHAAIVAKLSPVLNVLVNGPFKEALEQRVEWIDLEEAVFLSFWEFAYSGDYTNPIREDDEQEETDPVDEELSNWGKSWAHYVRHYPPFSGPNSRNTPGLKGLWQEFVDKYAPISRPPDVGNIGGDTLLHHAQVCIFADRYCMDKLMDVSLGKLFIALEAIIPWGNSWDSVMELLILASGKFAPVRLQEIVAEYILSQAELFKNEEVFQDFMSHHGGPMQGLLSRIFEPEDDAQFVSASTCDRLVDWARESGEFTDFAFTCEGETIPVHRIIVCSQSTVFHRACTGKFKEASSGTYELNDHPLQVVTRMVEYLYTGAYAVPDDACLLTHATMFTLADKYEIGGLQEFAGEKYLECLHQYHKFNNQDFTSSITEVYKVPREISKNLRNAALVLARFKLRKAVATEELEAMTEEFVYDCPEFAKELISLFIRFPLMGTCTNVYCKSEGLVPVEPLQCRCRKCGKGKANDETTLREWIGRLDVEFDCGDKALTAERFA